MATIVQYCGRGADFVVARSPEMALVCQLRPDCAAGPQSRGCGSCPRLVDPSASFPAGRCFVLDVVESVIHIASGERGGKSAPLHLAVAISACDFVLDILINLGADLPRQPWCGQHLTDELCRNARAFVMAFEKGPSGASRQPEYLGLLIERVEPSGDQGVANLANLTRLHDLKLCQRRGTFRALVCVFAIHLDHIQLGSAI
jgi:hypothetical protein